MLRVRENSLVMRMIGATSCLIAALACLVGEVIKYVAYGASPVGTDTSVWFVVGAMLFGVAAIVLLPPVFPGRTDAQN